MPETKYINYVRAKFSEHALFALLFDSFLSYQKKPTKDWAKSTLINLDIK